MCPIYLENNLEFQQASDYDNDIKGWMRPLELKWLYLAAQEMDSVVEVGSWRGRSTDALLASCKGTVWAVDHFKGNEEHTKEQKEDIQEAFLENVGHHKNLKLLKMDSIEAAKRLKDKSVDMVFIDGGHEYEKVRADIEAWLPKVKKLICGHDYFYGGINLASHEILGDVSTFDSIWIKPIKEAP